MFFSKAVHFTQNGIAVATLVYIIIYYYYCYYHISMIIMCVYLSVHVLRLCSHCASRDIWAFSIFSPFVCSSGGVLVVAVHSIFRWLVVLWVVLCACVCLKFIFKLASQIIMSIHFSIFHLFCRKLWVVWMMRTRTTMMMGIQSISPQPWRNTT